MEAKLQKFGALVKKEVFNRAKKYTNNENVKNGVAMYGTYNDLPEKLMKLRDDSVWHDIALRGKIKYFQGDGLAFEDQSELPLTVNDRGDSPNDMLEQVATNWALYSGFAVIVIWDQGSVAGQGLRIAEMIPVGFDKLRAEEADETGTIRNWYVAPKWKASTIRDLDKEAERVPIFNPNKVAKTMEHDGEPKQILVFKEYNPASTYYPEPSYKGALQSILTHSIVQKFKLAHLNNAIISALHIRYTGKLADGQAEEVMNDFDDQLTGAFNAGKPIMTHSPEQGTGFSFETLGGGGQANIYDSYSEMAKQEILSGHGILLPQAVGLPEEGTGLSAEQVEEKFTVFMNVTIRKNQQKILNGLNKLTPYWSNGVKLEINKTDIVEGLNEEVADDNIEDENEDGTLQDIVTPNTNQE